MDMEYGELHYTWKILGLEVTSVICLLNALGDTEDVTLLLTSEAVFLVSLEGKVTAYALLS
ncbi:Uncharacterized protein FKW44_023464 [Caligus rogercresseyi]|uniref:Uncharacterized protein n=1 Tax=Caligus rogercresseyi TaxID=217165 RepID=A0A7T8JV53_CALRO|nr:Uncharacterized protein FKW44_023464 [Caligus rogercresseyi]